MKRWAGALVAVTLALGGISAAPPHLVKACSDPVYRQENLALCNSSTVPTYLGGGPRRRGLLGLGIGIL